MLLTDGYWTPRSEQHDSAVDLTGATGAKYTWVCPFEKVSITRVAAVLDAATASLTTSPIITVQKVSLADVTTTLATLTFVDGMAKFSSYKADLDAGVGKNAPVRGELDYPELLFGERVVFNLTQSGIGGTQSARLLLNYLEKEADTR